MNGYMVTIDGGTTNTRCVLWDKNRRKTGEKQIETGARNAAIDSGNKALKASVRECLDELMSEAGVDWTQVERVMASGMLTSEVGLAAVPHIEAPAGLDELAKGLVTLELEDVCPRPICFIPGVRNKMETVGFDNYEAMDIMRGEEVECLPVIEAFSDEAPLLIILPGSHNKFIAVDERKRITGCVTSISGELLDCVTNHTILAKSVDRHFLSTEDYDWEWVHLGYENAKRTGLGRACFSARILSLYKDGRPEKIRNYILGAVLFEDIKALVNTKAIDCIAGRTAVVCGKNPLKQALTDILREEGILRKIHVFEPESGMPISSLGAFLVAEKRALEKP